MFQIFYFLHQLISPILLKESYIARLLTVQKLGSTTVEPDINNCCDDYNQQASVSSHCLKNTSN